jgi:antitoxin component of MazEF toxin-antitoxin module
VPTKRTHIVIPAELATQIDALVGKRGRSRFFTELAEREVRRRRLLQVLDEIEGTWKDEDHPELKDGAAKWVESLREEWEDRFRRVTGSA